MRDLFEMRIRHGLVCFLHLQGKLASEHAGTVPAARPRVVRVLVSLECRLGVSRYVIHEDEKEKML